MLFHLITAHVFGISQPVVTSKAACFLLFPHKKFPDVTVSHKEKCFFIQACSICLGIFYHQSFVVFMYVPNLLENHFDLYDDVLKRRLILLHDFRVK